MDVAVFDEFTELPQTGSLDVSLPDTPDTRTLHAMTFLLYIIDGDSFPVAPHDWVHVSLDRDGNLACDPALEFRTLNGTRTILPNSPVDIVWDSCSNENTLLRLALLSGRTVVLGTEEFIAVDSSGMMTVIAPEQSGSYEVELYYEHEGQRYWLRTTYSLSISEPQG